MNDRSIVERYEAIIPESPNPTLDDHLFTDGLLTD
jgi:hypothetical protein